MISSDTQLPIFSVSELSFSLKHLVEETFERIRVRGEISGLKRHSSGHVYFALKDDQSVLDGVCWRGSASRFTQALMEGAEVICLGRLTTYPGRSKYQIVVDQVELAGEGALLKLLEDRKKKLAAEGLFDLSRKKPLPFLPRCIGIITSPTGAVIRDILHRLEDRFPCPVLLWPVAVQGEGAAEQIAAAIRGFNALSPSSSLPKPDLLIVARGGGSLEDLWAFNEESVVRAAAESNIPLISAVGHETDTTLIDYASDWRAPTPTAAAEKAVPVREGLQEWLKTYSERMLLLVDRKINENFQRLDDRHERLTRQITLFFQTRQVTVKHLGSRLRHPREVLRQAALRLSTLEQQLKVLIKHRTAHFTQHLETLGKLLQGYSYHQTLKRGFSVIKDTSGKLMTSIQALKPGMAVDLVLQDGQRAAVIGGSSPSSKTPSSPSPQNPQKTFWE